MRLAKSILNIWLFSTNGYGREIFWNQLGSNDIKANFV